MSEPVFSRFSRTAAAYETRAVTLPYVERILMSTSANGTGPLVGVMGG